jgi:hypothetical protein
MQTASQKIRLISLIIILIMVPFYCQIYAASAAPQINTDKKSYNSGETIKVNFFNAPGDQRDWICIVPAGSPDDEGGDYKYMPRGLNQGVLTFDSPSPGKYEVRAYYNYSRNGYVVSARHGFIVEGDVSSGKSEGSSPAKEVEAGFPSGKSGGATTCGKWQVTISKAQQKILVTGPRGSTFTPNSGYTFLILDAALRNLDASQKTEVKDVDLVVVDVASESYTSAGGSFAMIYSELNSSNTYWNDRSDTIKMKFVFVVKMANIQQPYQFKIKDQLCTTLSLSGFGVDK